MYYSTVYLFAGHHPKTFSKIHADLKNYSQAKTKNMFPLSSEHTEILILIYTWDTKGQPSLAKTLPLPKSLKDLVSHFGNKRYQNGTFLLDNSLGDPKKLESESDKMKTLLHHLEILAKGC